VFDVGKDHRMVQTRRGAPRGRLQAGNAPGYEVGCGRIYRPGVNLLPEDADKIVLAARATNSSVSGLIQQLIARMEVDEDGIPTWFDKPTEEQQRLIA
jgi:hypothetical protein